MLLQARALPPLSGPQSTAPTHLIAGYAAGRPGAALLAGRLPSAQLLHLIGPGGAPRNSTAAVKYDLLFGGPMAAPSV